MSAASEQALAASPPPWLPAEGEARETGILFARVVRRRNFAGLPFWVSASLEACATVTERARGHAAAQGLATDLRLADLSPTLRGVLRERESLPENPAAFEGKRDFKRFFQGADAREHAVSGEAEHWTHARLFPALAFEAPSPSDEAAFSRSAEYGFLTSDPGFAGAGLQFEAGLHLPALVATRGLAAAQRALGALGFELRPLNRNAPGFAEAGYFRLLSRGGLGLSQQELAARFVEKTRALLRSEAESLEQWRARDPAGLGDQIHRAIGLLRSARQAEYGELLLWISRARTGALLGMLEGVPDDALEVLRVRAQPHHLAAENPGAPAGDASGLRARLARTLIAD